MDSRQWPPRYRMAVRQLAIGALDAPRSQASWLSVLRRSAVVAGFLALGVLTDRLDTAVFAAFGALQVGLGDAALPFRALARMLGATVLAVGVLGYVAMSLGGTWWSVPLLSGVAFLQGATMSVGPIPRTVGIGALAMGVIFAGIQADPLTAATWLAIGALTQSALWLVLWYRERALSVRILLANVVHSVDTIVTSSQPSGNDSNAASQLVDETLAAIEASDVPNRRAAQRVVRAANEARRNAIAWRQIEQPGLAERLRVSEQLRGFAHALSEGPGRVPPTATAQPETWPVGRALNDTIHTLQQAIGGLAMRDEGSRDVPATSRWRDWQGLRPGASDFRHGLRMAIALAMAQALSLVVPLPHAFWIPLTCVFVVKPDWAFTLVRSMARIAGNLLAVLLLPAILLATGSNSIAIGLVVFVISAVAFRFFTGSYILGSFGIAGTVLVLDQLISPDPNLYFSRILATVIGAAVGIAAVAIVPSWRSAQATRLVDDTVRGLSEWSHVILRAILDPPALDVAGLQEIAERERNNLIRLRPAAQAALLEPRPVADPRCVAVAVDAAARAHLCLLALSFHVQLMQTAGVPGLDIRSAAATVDAAFEQALVRVGAAAPTTNRDPVRQLRVAQTPEELAVDLQVVRLGQAAVDLSAAVGQMSSGREAA